MRAVLLILFFVTAASSFGAPEKIIVDTDSAYFNDDGAALAMLLATRERFDLRGITIVAGNEWPLQGAEYLLHVLELLHAEDVPVYLGADSPLVNNEKLVARQEREWGGLEWKAAFRFPRPKSRKDVKPSLGGKLAAIAPKKEGAVSFLIREIESHPHEITVLAIGPMTNLALAFQRKPDLAAKIRRLVFMGGNARVPGNSTPLAETNFWFDPEAASQVLRAPIPEKVMFGLDITDKAVLDRALFERVVKAKTPITELFADDLGRRYPGFYAHPNAKTYFWDCLAAGYLIDPSWVKASEDMYLEVVTQLGPAYGAVSAYSPPRKPGRHTPKVKVMLDLDLPKFQDLFVKLVTQAPLAR